MFGLIAGCVVTLLADAALNPDNRRAVRARLRRRRVARLRAQATERVIDGERERQHARKMRTIAETQLPHLRAVLAQAQKDYRYCASNYLATGEHAARIEKTLAEITSLEPWLDR